MRIKSRNVLFFTACLAVFTLFSGSGFAASTASLTVGSASGNVDQTLSIPITVDNPATIAGAAFTLQYSSSLSVTVDSTFFDTFYNQLNALNTTGTPTYNSEDSTYTFPVVDPDTGDPVLDDNGDPVTVTIPPTVDSIPYDQPLITNTEDDGATVSHHISAARVLPADSGGVTTLFTLTVSLKSGEASGTYDITIIPTTLNNTDAGYDAGGETIDLVVGSDLAKTIDSGQAFPIVLDDADYATHVTAGTAVFAGDSDGDGLPDGVFEMNYFGDLSHDGTADSDNDGYTDLQESINGTDPTDGTTSQDLAGYSACNDDRVAGTLQTVTLSTSGSSAPGETLVLSATYDISDGANTSGIDINIFYNSSKVTYAGYDTNTFLNAGDTVTTPDDVGALDDSSDADNDPNTDKMVRMAWDSSASAWPGESLPALLADLNFTVNGALEQGVELPFSVMDASHAAGYSFCGQGITASVNIWNLDIDGDGTVGALTDGLLVVRYIFGFNAVSGWTEGFVKTGATRDETAINAFIKSGIDMSTLDIDGDGTVGALTDGLLVVRYVFGFNAVSGWTDGFVKTGATRDEADINTYIQSLIP
ncbi:MAG: hypothetical protein GXP53_01775 [Deltaproteobacteria bacterium]|nr:hypothetical protein [Deltaproteobacteria bacterium]